ncbi:uncharacterized protein JCM10292_001795 [Rhodotorula paludigena]|uniref:uncharacterized protein n=1 Tax=Rhodotorula paludigena TaxID=86838 RepID=UPI0031742F58
MPPPDYPRLPTGYRFDPARLQTLSRSLDFASADHGQAARCVRAAAALALAAHSGEDRYDFAVNGGVIEGEVERDAPVSRLIDEVGQAQPAIGRTSDDDVRLVVIDGQQQEGADRPPSTPLHLVAALSSSGTLSLFLSYDSTVLPTLEATWFLDHVVAAALSIAAAEPGSSLGAITLAPPGEAAILEGYSSCPDTIHEPNVYPPAINTLPSFFLHAAQQYPSDPALHFIPTPSDSPTAGSLVLSYAQLSHLAHYLAAHLLLSTPPTERKSLVLPIVVDKSPSMIVSLLAASLAGFAYLALEPAFPEARKRGICDELAEKNLLAPVAVVQSADGEQAHWEGWTGMAHAAGESGAQGQTSVFECVVDPNEVLGPLHALASETDSLDTLRDRFPVPDLASVGGWPVVKEDDLAYVIYTSGTTGKPKGIMVEHRNVAAFLRNYRGVFGRTRGERVLQFPSYSFDVSVMNIWDTFAHGATLCLTTPSSLYSSLADSILALDCTLVDLTPTIASLLFEHDEAQPRDGESVRAAWQRAGFRIKQVNTGGERVEKAVREKWRDRGVRVVIDYGPTETTVGVISNQSLAPSPPAPFSLPIGRPTGSTRIYILPSHSPTALTPLPLGCIGEICVLGPQVTRGYVRAELDEGVFVPLAGDEEIGQKGERVYRTGDLGRWFVAEWEQEGETEGWIECLGRKDGQVKVNGLRIEVGEIEEHLSSKTDAAVVRGIVDKVEASAIGTALVAFLELSSSFSSIQDAAHTASDEPQHAHSAGAISVLPLTSSSDFLSLVDKLKEELSSKLPAYMVPRYWLAVNRIPTQGMGKADRKTLRGIAEAHNWRGASARTNGTNGAQEEQKRTFTASPHHAAARRAWAHILRLSDDDAVGESIADEDEFTKLGGDSIRFMKLVGVLRAQGYVRVTFRDLAQAGTLDSCARALERVGCTETDAADVGEFGKPYERLSLVPEPQRAPLFAELAAFSPTLPRERIVDVYPTSPAQDALLAPSFDSPRGHYYAQAVYAVGVGADELPLEKLQRGVSEMVRRHDALREVFIISETIGRTLAVVIGEEDEEVRARSKIEQVAVTKLGDCDSVISDWLLRDREQHSFQWGRLSLSFALFTLPDGARKLAWSMHHAMSDGWTLELLTADLRNLCFDLPAPDRPSFGSVASWWLSESEPPQDTADFWRSYLTGAVPLNWPTQEALDGDMLATTGAAILHWSGELDALSQRHGITPAIASRLAILIALQYHASASDVNVGIVRSGRDIDVPDADEIIGPCVSVLPSRIRFDSSTASSSLFSLAKAEAEADRLARLHQHVTLSQLARICTLPSRADLFDILVTFQSLAERDPAFEMAAPWPIRQPPERIQMPTNYTLSFEVTPELHNKDRLELACFFDERIIEKREVEGVLKTVATVLDYLTTAPCTTVGELRLGSEGGAAGPPKSKQATTNGTSVASPSPADFDPETMDILKRLQKEWAVVLRMDEGDFGAQDSFGSLGGDSIMTMRLAVRLKKVGLAIPTPRLAKLPTLAQQARWLRQQQQ